MKEAVLLGLSPASTTCQSCDWLGRVTGLFFALVPQLWNGVMSLWQLVKQEQDGVKHLEVLSGT